MVSLYIPLYERMALCPHVRQAMSSVGIAEFLDGAKT